MLKKIYLLSDQGNKSLLKACFWMTLYNMATILPVIILALVTDNMLQLFWNKTNEQIPILIYIVLSTVIVAIIFLTHKGAYRNKYVASGNEGANLRMNLAEKIRKLPLSYIGNRDLSDLTSTIMDDAGTIEKTLATSLTEFVGGLFSSVTALILLFFIDIRMSLSLSACLIISIIVMSLSRKISEGTNIKNRKRKLAVSDGLQEYLENAKVLRSSPQKSEYQNDLKKTILKTIPGAIFYEFLAGITVTIASNAMRIGLGLVIITGASLLINGELSLLKYFLFLFIAVRIYEPLAKSCEKLGELIFSLVSANRIRETMEFKEQTGREDLIPNRYDIEFNNVTFGYNKEIVLHNVSFVAKQGEITALVGPSGCGKSTVCKLASRFWDVENGTISVGGVNVNEVAPETLLQNFSFVFQDVVLFNDTIFNNIKIGKENATKDEVIAAAKLARCEDFIDKLPDGYDTVIGENGKTLSGGERQRLSIARAFLKDAPIILLDELTASIDPENETKIQEAIGKLIVNKTVLIIAHKLRSIEDSDKIIVLKEGQIEEIGIHKELLNNNGLYSKLYKLQKESMSWEVKH